MNNDMPAPIVEQTDADPHTQQGQTTSSFRSKGTDPGFLVAKGRFHGETDDDRKNAEKKHVKKLASAIFMAMSNHGYATIRAVGPFANYNAVKAITIAMGYCAPKGIELCFVPSFDEGNLGSLRQEGHVDGVTAMVYSVKGYKEWAEEEERDG